MESRVINEIVKTNICIGCGICAGICPQQSLVMQFNDCGEYVPSIQQYCNLCDLCLNVCPFYGENENETDLGRKLYGNIRDNKYLFETGYHIDSFVGYSCVFRGKSASGGMTTWLLTTLLREKFVDHVICVTSHNSSEQLFKYAIFENTDSVSSSSGSVYYPVELSQVIKKILDEPGRYAIVGLPCFIKGLRLASQKNIKLMERIVFTIGLVCGQMKTKQHTTYLSTMANVGGELGYVNYRGKSADKPATNYHFHCINEKGIEGKIFWNEGVSQAWVNRWFTPNACNFCDDVFAELADITFMDAWLPEYSLDEKGTNLIIVRLPIMRDIILKGITNKEININKIEINRIIQSQKDVINFKRRLLSYRCQSAKKIGLKVPRKRVGIFKIGYFEKQYVNNKINMQNVSKDIFVANFQKNLFDIKNFRNDMRLYLYKSKLINFFMLIEKFMHYGKGEKEYDTK